jgi:hypothetical protein
MKSIKSVSVLAVVGAVLLAGACDSGFTDINTNPNAPTDVPAQYILPQAIQTTVGTGAPIGAHQYGYGSTWSVLEFAGLFAQHWAKIQYTDEDMYLLRDGVIENLWTVQYANSLKDWQAIVDKGVETGLVNQEATGRTMKAFNFHFVTDIWGDVPYSEALQGDGETKVTAPAYDPQSAIYADMVAQLGTAVGMFNPGAPGWGTADLMYGGDIAAWARFANSLRLRLGMRMVNSASTQARQAVEAAAAHSAGLITTNSQNAVLRYLDSAPNQSPLFANARSRNDHAPSRTLVNMLGAFNDPRLPIYAEPVQNDSLAMGNYVIYDGKVYRGAQNSVESPSVPPLPTISRIGYYWRGGPSAVADFPSSATTPTLLMTAAEVHFLLAEAALRGWNVPGTAQGHYEAGIRAAMAQYDGAMGIAIPTARVDAYLLQNGVAWGTAPTGDNLELIIKQKWLALYTNGFEAYAEYRRTGYPTEITVGPDAAFSFVPGRIPYPGLEQSLNRTNWEAAKAAQGNDGAYAGKVWWMP